jgi:thioredoxin reductase
MPVDSTVADVIVVGGSFSGISAALQLARARRRVVVVDAGQRRNRFASASHGFLGQDGRPPADIVADARQQLLAYPNVRWIDGAAEHAEKSADPQDVEFTVRTASETLRAKRLLLATGVVDTLPLIEGLQERWGQSVFHCPYCHGYELNNGHIGVLGVGPMSQHHALLLPEWGTVTLFLNNSFAPDAEQTAALGARGVTIEATPIARLEDAATVVLTDGRRVPLAGLFTLSQTRVASPLPAQLGCAFDEGPLGAYIRRNEMFETTVPGVLACGDAARMFGNVAIAVGDGAAAGASTHRTLVFGLPG